MSNTNKKIVHTRIQNKRELEADWKKATGFIPLAGELIIFSKEVDSNGNILELPSGRTIAFTYDRFAFGDGVTPVSELSPEAISDVTQKTQVQFVVWGADD